MKKKFTIFIFFLLFSITILFSGSYINAVDMNSPSYRIQYGNVNIGARNQTSSSFNLSTTIGQLAAGEFSSTGYTIKAGFQYWHSIIPFRFSIANTRIDLGTLLPNTPSTVSTTLTVYFGGAGQYQVTALEEGQLRTFSNNPIRDTSCNGAGESCTENSAKLWNNSTAYGFGYNMSGHDVPTDFSDSNHYRPFPDRTNDESPAVIMTSTNVGINRQSTITFKANISNIQAAGSYRTIISFVALPTF